MDNNNQGSKIGNTNYKKGKFQHDNSNQMSDHTNSGKRKRKVLKWYIISAVLVFLIACVFAGVYTILKIPNEQAIMMLTALNSKTSIEKTVIVDYNGIVITAEKHMNTGMGYEGIIYSIKNDSAYDISYDVTSFKINGILMDASIALSSPVVKAGEAETSFFIYDAGCISYAGFNKIESMEIDIDVKNNADSSLIYDGEPVLLPVKDRQKRESPDILEYTLYDSNGITFKFLGANAKKKLGDIELYFYVDNKTDSALEFAVDNARVNGQQRTDSFYLNVDPQAERYGGWHVSFIPPKDQENSDSYNLNFAIDMKVRSWNLVDPVATARMDLIFDNNGTLTNTDGKFELIESDTTAGWEESLTKKDQEKGVDSGGLGETIALTIGDQDYSVSYVECVYWFSANSLISMGSNLSRFFTIPDFYEFDKVDCPLIDSGTWRDYCLDNAIDELTLFYAICDYATKNGISLEEDDENGTYDSDYRDIIDAIEDYDESELEEELKSIGNEVTVDSFVAVLRQAMLADKAIELLSPDQESFEEAYSELFGQTEKPNVIRYPEALAVVGRWDT